MHVKARQMPARAGPARARTEQCSADSEPSTYRTWINRVRRWGRDAFCRVPKFPCAAEKKLGTRWNAPLPLQSFETISLTSLSARPLLTGAVQGIDNNPRRDQVVHRRGLAEIRRINQDEGHSAAAEPIQFLSDVIRCFGVIGE